VLLGLAAAYFVDDRRRQARDEQALREVVAELDARYPDGWQLAALPGGGPKTPETEEIDALLRSLREPLERWAKDRDFDLITRPDPQTRLDADQLRAVRAAVEAARPLLDQLRPYAEPRPGRVLIDWRPDPYQTPLPQIQTLRFAGNLLALRAVERAEAGDREGAVAAVRTALNTAAWVRDVGAAIPQLVRAALAEVNGRSVECLLARLELSPEQLAELLRAVEADEASPPFVTILRGELALHHAFFEAVGRGDASFANLGTEEAVKWDRRLSGSAARYHLRSAEAETLRYGLRALDVTRLPLHEQAGPIARLVEELHTEAAKTSPAPLLLDGLSKLHTACLRHHSHRRALAAALAAERFRQARGRWPDSLGELVPAYLGAVPADPFTGEPLRLSRLADGVVIYGVGPDKADDGGRIDRRNPTAAGADLGYRLWDVAQRGQSPPPPGGPGR
jgi:hypothetical protein